MRDNGDGIKERDAVDPVSSMQAVDNPKRENGCNRPGEVRERYQFVEDEMSFRLLLNKEIHYE